MDPQILMILFHFLLDDTRIFLRFPVYRILHYFPLSVSPPYSVTGMTSQLFSIIWRIRPWNHTFSECISSSLIMLKDGRRYQNWWIFGKGGEGVRGRLEFFRKFICFCTATCPWPSWPPWPPGPPWPPWKPDHSNNPNQPDHVNC